VAFLVLAASASAQDFDPTLQILPLQTEAELIADWRFAEAVALLEAKKVDIETAMAELAVTWETSRRDDPRRPRWLTAFVNASLVEHLRCHALEGLLDSRQSPAACVEQWEIENRDLVCIALLPYYAQTRDLERCMRNGPAPDDSWATYFQSWTRALILEAEGRNDEALEAYYDALSLRFELDGLGFNLMSHRIPAASASSLVEDALEYRIRRLKLAAVDNRYLRSIWQNLLSCPAGGGPLCPAASATLHAVSRYVGGYRLAAADALTDVLTRPQYWLGLDAYEHPLFWLAALRHRNGESLGVQLALSHQNEIRDLMTPDVRYVLDLYAGAAEFDGAIPDVCDTAGCRYFLAQYLYGLDRTDDANDVLRTSRAMCEDVATLMCAVVRYSNAKLDAGGSP